jgi:Tol biopolymer transport system component
MTAERYQQLKALYHAALERPANERTAFLIDACAEDEALRIEIEALLARTSGSFLQTPAIDLVAMVTPLSPGSRHGPYLILEQLGAGGMGEVYRARDEKLGRDVAIKVLTGLSVVDVDRRARFEREARALAALNHPHIGGIYGLEDWNGVPALVLELVEGATLEQRIAHGAIPIREAVSIAVQIVDALDATHEKGIVHRDLKPTNIMITPDRIVKILDFGLAKHEPQQPTDDDTRWSAIATREGVVLGTAAYMSPEQARGQRTDKRTDIWAFGCVLFEMLTSQRAFEGATASDAIAAILERAPNWAALPASVPAGTRRLLERCLEKDPKDRLRDIADARAELEEVGVGDPHPEGTTGRYVRSDRVQRIVWAAALLVVGAAALAFHLWPSDERAVAEMRVDITTPSPTSFDLVSFAVSPDGRKLVFAGTENGRSQLWLRHLDTTMSKMLPGTQEAQYPFWSPDSRSVAFFAEDKLKTIDIDGGPARTLGDAHIGDGGTWSRDGTLVSSQAPLGRLFRVSSSGGEATALTPLDAPPGSHRFPHLLPDGKHILYYVFATPEATGVYVCRSDGSDSQRLFSSDSAAVYSSGHLFFARQGKLLAQLFDPARLQLSGDPISVADQIALGSREGAVALSASMAGPIAFRSGSPAHTELEWFDRSGATLSKLAIEGGGPALSPDGHVIALHRFVNGNMDIWLVDDSGKVQRFTADPADDVQPAWSPDGKRIVFGSSRRGQFDLYVKDVGSVLGSEALLLDTKEFELVPDWAPDGQSIVYRRLPSINAPNYEIWALPLTGDRKPFPILQTPFDTRDARFSPDGKWIMYQSNESGRREIYIRAFSGSERTYPISVNGGTQGRWSGDGREIYYIAPDDRLMTAPIQGLSDGKVPHIGTPSPLFVTRVFNARGANPQYTVSRDGKRFLIHTTSGESSTTPAITVIVNWNPKS